MVGSRLDEQKFVIGNYSELEKFFSEKRLLLMGYAFRVTRNRDMAEDFIQEAYLKVFKELQKGKPVRASYAHFFQRMFLNMYIDKKRSKSYKTSISLTGFTDHRHPSVTIDQEIHSRINLAELENRLNQILDESRHEELYLHELHEVSYQEIADLKQTSVSTVKSRIHRARKILRDNTQWITNQ